MADYVIKRLLWLVPVMLGVSLIVFGIMKTIPGDSAEVMVGLHGTGKDVEDMRRVLGLDQPLIVQYGKFLQRLVVFDLGESNITQREVTEEIRSRIRPTAELAAASLLLATTIGVTAGVITATRRYTLWDTLATLVAIVGVSAPVFWTGLMLMMVFSVWLGVLPATGAGSLKQLIMPAIALGAASTAIIFRQSRSAMLEVLSQEYIRVARAKGITENRVVIRHALRNALIPTVTVVGLQVGYLLGGSVLTETVFARPGLGSFLVESIRSRDIPSVQGTIMFLALVFVLVSLLVDLMYMFLDPRIALD